MTNVGQGRLGFLLLILALGSITVGLQTWVGDNTIYAKSFEAKRLELHDAILANKAPAGSSWEAVGASTTNLRIGAVYLAAGIRKVTGLGVGKVYKLLDTVFLFAALTGLFFYLRRWLPDVYCLIGVLYCCAFLPLTYFLYYFHPWDRIQFAIWLLLLYLIRERRPVLLAAGLAASMIVKYDAIVLPALYFLVHATRERWQRTALESIGLFAAALCVYVWLKWLFPAPVGPEGLLSSGPSIVQYNIAVLASMNLTHPALVVHGVPVLLAAIGIWSRERFVWASALFGFGLLAVFFAFSRFEEVRAHFIILPLLMPAALLSLQQITAHRSAIAHTADRPSRP